MASGTESLEQGLADKTRVWVWLAFVVGVGVIASHLYARNAYLLLDANQDLSSVAVDVFGKYLALVVAVERAATVFIGMFRNQNRIYWSIRINRISEVLEQENAPAQVLRLAFNRERRLIKQLEEHRIIATIENIPNAADKDDYRGYLSAAKHAYEFQRAQFNSVSNRYVALAVLVVGIILAALGLSLFQDVFQQTPAPSAVQAGFLRFADIFMTGGLLGGGSAGLNAVVTKVSDYTIKK